MDNNTNNDFRNKPIIRKSTSANAPRIPTAPTKYTAQVNPQNNGGVVVKEGFVDVEEVDDVFNNLLNSVRNEQKVNAVPEPNIAPPTQQIQQRPAQPAQPVQQRPVQQMPQQPMNQAHVQTYVNAQGQLVQRVYTNAQGQPVPAPQGHQVPGQLVSAPMQQPAQPVQQRPAQPMPQQAIPQSNGGITVQQSNDPVIDLSDIFGDAPAKEDSIQVVENIEPIEAFPTFEDDIIITQEMEEVVNDNAIDLEDIFVDDTNEVYEEEPISSNPIFQDTQIESEEEIIDLSDIFDDGQVAYTEDPVETYQTVETYQPIESSETQNELYDLSDIFSENGVASNNVVVDEEAQHVESDENVTYDLTDIFSDDQSLVDTNFTETSEVNNAEVNAEVNAEAEVINDESEYEDEFEGEMLYTNVFDAFNNPLSKEKFVIEFIEEIPNVYDQNSNLLTKNQLQEMINNDTLVVYDEFGGHVIKLILVKDINTALKIKEEAESVESNVFNEFNKPVSNEELLKEYNTNSPNLFNEHGEKLTKEGILLGFEENILVIAEYGKRIDSSIVIAELKNKDTAIFDKYGNELNKELLAESLENNSDMYDKYENQIFFDDIISKIDEGTIIVRDLEGKKVTKTQLLKDVCGFVELYDIDGIKLTKANVKQYIIQNNIEYYGKNNQTLSSGKIVEIFEQNNIQMTNEYEKKLLGKKSNVFNEYGDPLSVTEFINEYRNVLPRLLDSTSKKIAKKDIIDLIKDGTLYIVEDGEKVDSNYLVKELQINIHGVFTKGKEELSSEELISEIHQGLSVYDFNNNELSTGILINNLRNEINIIYDINGNTVSVSDLVAELEENYVLGYDLYKNQLTKEILLEQLSSGNKKIYSEIGSLLSNNDVRTLLVENNITITPEIESLLFDAVNNEERPFADINEVDEMVDFDDNYKDIVIARKENDNVVIVTYNESYEARLNLSKDFTKDYHNLIKNKLLSYAKSKSKVSWNYDAFTVGKVNLAKIDIEIDTLYLYLNVNVDELSPEFKYKDFSDKKAFANTPIRMKVQSMNEVRFAYELIDHIAATNKIVEDANFVMVNYYQENRGFDKLISEELIKEIVSAKTSKSLTNFNASTLVGNNITSICKDVVKDIVITNEFYNDVLSRVKPNHDINNKALIHTDTVCRAFHENDIVNIDSLKNLNLIPSNATFVKCVARGVLDKSLTFELDDYSKDAIKMILITNGTIQ